MDQPDLVARFETAAFAILGTHGPEDRIDLVPCCFALTSPPASQTSPGELDARLRVVTAVDHKPKRHQRLARLDNINRNPNVTMLVDERHDDWSRLWWVRLEGRASVETEGLAYDGAIDALVARYRQYQDRRPTGPAIVIEPVRWRAWAAR